MFSWSKISEILLPQFHAELDLIPVKLVSIPKSWSYLPTNFAPITLKPGPNSSKGPEAEEEKYGRKG